jgi:hypothetical protein
MHNAKACLALAYVFVLEGDDHDRICQSLPACTRAYMYTGIPPTSLRNAWKERIHRVLWMFVSHVSTDTHVTQRLRAACLLIMACGSAA